MGWESVFGQFKGPRNIIFHVLSFSLPLPRNHPPPLDVPLFLKLRKQAYISEVLEKVGNLGGGLGGGED